MDISEVQTTQGKQYLFAAIDRTSKFAYAELHDRATKAIAADFLRCLIEAVPYRIHTVLTDNGIQLTHQARHQLTFRHIFDRVYDDHGIDHRLTSPQHPWTNGQVERLIRTLKEATVKTYQYVSHSQLKQDLYDFLMAYNFAKRLKTLKGLPPYESVRQNWTRDSSRFHRNPLQHTLGLNT